MNRSLVLALTVVLAPSIASVMCAQPAPSSPETLTVRSGDLALRALVWRPAGRGPFPAVLFNHGSGPADVMTWPDRMELGPMFARHGYVFLVLHRRGAGLSVGQGANSYDVMGKALADSGRDARNRIQLRLLEGDDLRDAAAGLARLRSLPDVDPRRIALVGHSFGGSLTMLLAERDTTIRGVVVFGAAAGSWEGSPELRLRLAAAVRRATAPILFVHSVNDYSVRPGRELSAEMKAVGKPHRLAIYPPVGKTAAEGHEFIFRAPSAWESDVFTFLKERTQ